MKNFVKILSVLLAIAGATNASATLLTNAVGIDPVSAISTSNFGAPYTTAKTIDQSDLSAHYVSGVTSTSVIDGLTNLNTAQGWHGSAGQTTGSITFDLGASFTLDRIYLYWMNGGSVNNIANFSIQVGNDSSFSSSVIAASFGTPSAAKQRIDFSALATGEFVRLNWTSLQGSYPGLNEFIAGGVAGQTSVPEPATLALLGLGLLGFAVSRKRQL